MQVSRFNLSFTYKGSKLTANCQQMKVHNYPQIRVAANREKNKTDIYIFYEINELNQKYFWFQLSGIKEEIARVIAKKLEDKMVYST